MFSPVIVPLGALSSEGVGMAVKNPFFGPGLAVSSMLSVSFPLPSTNS